MHRALKRILSGSVRDALLNKPIHDVDIATSAYPEEIKQILNEPLMWHRTWHSPCIDGRPTV